LKAPFPHATLPRAGLVLLVLLTVFWGFNWPVMKFTLAEIPLWTFRALCIAGGAAGLFAIAAASRLPLRVPRGQWPRLLLIALFNITGWNLFSAYGVSLLPSGRAAIIAYTMPLWSVLLSVWLLGEPMTRRRLAGLALGMLGILALIGGELGGLRAAPLGAMFMLGAALSWALGTVCMKRYPLAMPTAVMTAWIMLLGGAPIFIGAAVLDTGSLHAYGTRANLGLAYNMVVCFVFCYWAWFKIVEMVPVSVSALSTLLIPVVGVFSGLWVLGEVPGPNDLMALALVAAALATVLIAPAAAPAEPSGRA
jgi:drug/metabolite transporter (DMT)-like permease